MFCFKQRKKIYLKNTLSGQVEIFKSLNKDQVRMYHCGPTVYNQAHIGNFRPYVFADILRKTFEYSGYRVKQVINITDVGHLTDDGDSGEDKVEKAAKEKEVSATEITEHYTDLFLKDLQLLNINPKKIIFPKATEYIKDQIDFIKKLEEKNLMYKISDGIYFDTSKFSDYGKLGGINLEGLKEGERIGKNDEKKNPTDFAVWKFSKPESKRLQEWNSPWGVGFPGWHLECSVMAQKLLGETFDIHTGGIEHIPVHHNNEIAQSESVCEKTMANYWLHSNHVLINGEKMSKSLGNILYLSDLKIKYDPIVYRYLLLTAKYDSLINFTDEALSAADTAYKRLLNTFRNISDSGKINKKYLNKILKALFNDFNTPIAISEIWNLVKDFEVKIEDKKKTVLEVDKILSLDLENKIKEVSIEKKLNIPENIQKKIEERKVARENSDWSKSDKIREEIENQGYIVRDTENGQVLDKK